MAKIIVIGGGVIGCAVARELTAFDAEVTVLEKSNDVATGTSKANSGIVHAGFDAHPGTLKAKFNVLGARLMESEAKTLDFPFRRNGAFVLNFDADGNKKLEELKAQGEVNGVEGLRIMSGDEVREMEPEVSGEVVSALYAPSSGIVGPYEMTIAYAENAAHNGAKFAFGACVTGVEKAAKGFTVTADANGHVKGYVSEPEVMLPANDVAKAVDLGVLSVIKDIGLKEPYVGDTHLVSGEIAEDLTYYFATSDQIPSSVALGVLFNDDTSVANAGGFIIQLMPFAEDALIDELEKRLKGFSFTALLKQGMSVEAIVRKLFEGYDVELTDSMPCAYVCDCSKERVEQAVISLGRKELGAMIADNKPIEVVCDFCHTKYTFSPDELLNILKNK